MDIIYGSTTVSGDVANQPAELQGKVHISYTIHRCPAMPVELSVLDTHISYSIVGELGDVVKELGRRRISHCSKTIYDIQDTP